MDPSVVVVAVLGGTGQQGRGIAQRLARAGYPVVVGSRDPARARSIEHLTLLAVGINRRHRIRDARFRIVGL